jgi:hypothetical protein
MLKAKVLFDREISKDKDWLYEDCMKIQSDLHKLSEWCERNSLYKSITFSRTCYPVEFANTWGSSCTRRTIFWSMWTSWLVRLLLCKITKLGIKEISVFTLENA